MNRRTLGTLVAVAAVLAIAITSAAYLLNDESPTPPAVAQKDPGVQPAAQAAPMLTEQIPQYTTEGFIPPPSEATGSSPPEAVAPKS